MHAAAYYRLKIAESSLLTSRIKSIRASNINEYNYIEGVKCCESRVVNVHPLELCEKSAVVCKASILLHFDLY